MKNHYVKECKSCELSSISRSYDRQNRIDEEDVLCENCKKPNSITFFEQLTDVDTIIEIAGMVLEDYNHHSITGVPRDVWDNIKDEFSFFSDAKKASVARKLALTFENDY